MSLSQIKFVLVETSHPGNLGAATRAIANMGFTRLALVSPKANKNDPIAISRAANSAHILEQAQIFDSLDAAVADCNLVFATRARENSIKWTEYTPRFASEKVWEHLSCIDNKVAIVFGPEKTGLSNAMLEQCCGHIIIPTSDYSSLNLAQAIQIIAYELFLKLSTSSIEDIRFSQDKEQKAFAQQMHDLFLSFEEVMITTKFLDPNKPKKLMPKLRSLFMRADMSVNEVQMLRGFLSAIKEYDRLR
ncbi:MAG: RNA methyltransferase [Francisellaceae bacterium]|jgi:tRNA (cytidine32/uridine32-2'-O)-methyltransferase|nr:RNA methyltransferase [Francisellaceae bacterium]MBT6539216.1 RNA methyltransferase [Francisellaceae bacterium]